MTDIRTSLNDENKKVSVLKSFPKDDGYRMPAEYEAHEGTMMIWPVRPGSWTNAGKEAKPVFAEIARAIAEGEKVYMLANGEHYEEACQVFSKDKNIEVLNIKTDDAWARDVGPTFVTNKQAIDISRAEVQSREGVRGIDWQFNAWGGSFDGLYEHYENDNRAAGSFCKHLNYDYYDASDFVLEGGSIHSDGEGTVIVTETCLLSEGRNPQLSKEQIESKLKNYLGAKKIIWLPRGIAGDETNEHVDNVCAFVGPAEVVLAWTEDKNDLQWGPSHETLKVLESQTDAKGRSFTIHKLLIPEEPVRVTAEELAALEFEEGEDMREVGERLAASYVNFYISNKAVLVPQFGDVNDKKACQLIGSFFPDRKVVRIKARPIIVGGGNIHCITQQIPKNER